MFSTANNRHLIAFTTLPNFSTTSTTAHHSSSPLPTRRLPPAASLTRSPTQRLPAHANSYRLTRVRASWQLIPVIRPLQHPPPHLRPPTAIWRWLGRAVGQRSKTLKSAIPTSTSFAVSRSSSSSSSSSSLQHHCDSSFQLSSHISLHSTILPDSMSLDVTNSRLVQRTLLRCVGDRTLFPS